MGTTILESKGSWMEGMDRHTYWILPLHILTQTVWYKLFGFSLMTMRSLSIFWGAVILIVWCGLVSKLSGNRIAGLLTAGLLAIDYHFLAVAALGRMDAMCAALGWGGCATFILLRQRSFSQAILVSNILVAASCFTHPFGALYFLVLMAWMLYFDHNRLRFRDWAVAAVPYLAGFGAWGLYILQDPAHFWSQFGGNASGIAYEFTTFNRWSGLSAPFAAFRWELVRYAAAYSWYSVSGFWPRLQIVIPAIYGLGVITALTTPSIRRHAGYRALLLMGFLLFVVMALFEGLKSATYLVHTLPLAAALFAACVTHCTGMDRERESRPLVNGVLRGAVIAVMVLLVCLQMAFGVKGYVRPRGLWAYTAALDFVRRHAAPADRILGGAEMAFDLGFDANLIDDPRLGFYSGKRGDWIVANPIYRGWFARSQVRYPEIHQHLQQLLRSSYREVFHNALYTIYQRVADSSSRPDTPAPERR